MPPTDGGAAGLKGRGRQEDSELGRLAREEASALAAAGAQGAAATRPGEAILASMSGRSPDATAPGNERRLAIYQTVERAVQRLLVTDSSVAQRQEVRLQLRNDLLPGVELRVFRDQGGVRIDFVASTPDSLQWLQQNRDAINTELRRGLREEVSVAVEAGQDARGEDGSDRRSRGYEVHPEEEEE